MSSHKRKGEDAADAGDQHLQSVPLVPPWLQGTTDIAQVVQGQKFPLLAMHSKILAEAIACSNGAQVPKGVPLDGYSLDTIHCALSHIYGRKTMTITKCSSHLKSSKLMAIHVALCAHKYDAATLAEEAENALEYHMASRGQRAQESTAETSARPG